MFSGNCSNQLGTANPNSSIFVAHRDPFVGYGTPYSLRLSLREVCSYGANAIGGVGAEPWVRPF